MASEKLLEDYLELITYGFTNPMPDATEGAWKLTAKDIVNGRINFETARKTPFENFNNNLTAKSRPKIGDVLLTKDGSLGRLAIVMQENICVNQSVAVLRPNDKLFSKYLYYLLSSPKYQHQMLAESDGSVLKHIYITRVGKMKVQIPSLEKQKTIAHILGSLDDKIELNRQMNATLEAMAQALFKSWFVDFDPVLDNALAAGNPIPDELQSKAAARLALGDARKPLPAEIQALFPSSFILTEEMGWIPEGWEVVTLNSITTELKRGISPKYLETGGVQVVNQRCIRNHEINFNLCRRHDDVKKKIDNQYIKIGDVLINSTGVGTLGRVAQVSDLLEPAIVDSHITIVRVEEEQYLPYSFGQMIITKENIIEAMGEGSTGQTELSRKNLAELIVLKPNLKILEQSDKGIKGYIDKIGINNKQISILTKLRDTLLPKLLSGELRIPDAEKIAAEVL